MFSLSLHLTACSLMAEDVDILTDSNSADYDEDETHLDYDQTPVGGHPRRQCK